MSLQTKWRGPQLKWADSEGGEEARDFDGFSSLGHVSGDFAQNTRY